MAVREEFPGAECVRDVVFVRLIKRPHHCPLRRFENQIDRITEYAQRNINRLGNLHGAFCPFEDLDFLEPRHKFVKLMIVQHDSPHGVRRLVDDAVGFDSSAARAVPCGVDFWLDYRSAFFYSGQFACRESGGRGLTCLNEAIGSSNMDRINTRGMILTQCGM